MKLTIRFPLAILLLLCSTWLASAADLSDLRKQLAQTLHVPEKLPNLQTRAYGKFTPAAGVEAELVSYTTEYGLRIPAIIYRSTSQHHKGPALIVVNGHQGDKSSWYAYWAGILYARAGAVVLTYDPLGEFERNKERLSKSGQHDQYIPPDDMARRLSGLMITDVEQAVSYLRKRKDVDSRRIAVLGFSMGSFVSSLACAVDWRIHACVITGGGNLDGLGGHWDHSQPMCESIPYKSLQFLGERGPAIYALNARRGPTLIFNGTGDTVADIPHYGENWFRQLRAQTASMTHSSKNLFDFSFAPGGGHRPYFLTKPVALWLESKLNFPNWTPDQIKAMPETHISQWALKNQVVSQITPQFDHDAGGTLALGVDLPAVPRDQLHAIPEAIWDESLQQYVYETWVERAKAAIRSAAP